MYVEPKKDKKDTKMVISVDLHQYPLSFSMFSDSFAPGCKEVRLILPWLEVFHLFDSFCYSHENTKCDPCFPRNNNLNNTNLVQVL